MPRSCPSPPARPPPHPPPLPSFTTCTFGRWWAPAHGSSAPAPTPGQYPELSDAALLDMVADLLLREGGLGVADILGLGAGGGSLGATAPPLPGDHSGPGTVARGPQFAWAAAPGPTRPSPAALQVARCGDVSVPSLLPNAEVVQGVRVPPAVLSDGDRGLVEGALPGWQAALDSLYLNAVVAAHNGAAPPLFPTNPALASVGTALQAAVSTMPLVRPLPAVSRCTAPLIPLPISPRPSLLSPCMRRSSMTCCAIKPSSAW